MRLYERLKGIASTIIPQRVRRTACSACGHVGRVQSRSVLWPELIAEWQLPPEWVRWFDDREGSQCEACGSSLRSRHLAKVISETIAVEHGVTEPSLARLVANPQFQRLTVCEINSAGNLHQFLQTLPHLYYSEYGSSDPAVPSENLLALSYPDNTFDLVVTSETLEHVPDVDKALSEIRRVLKVGGHHVFTVPLVSARQNTKQRARIVDGVVVHDHPPSYHGSRETRGGDLLVFYEFGSDFLERCKAAGFATVLHTDPDNPANVAITAERIK